MVFKLGHYGKPIKIPLQFRNVVLAKDGDQLDPSCEKKYYKATHNPSGRTMALGSTQPLTEMSTMCISWG
jgi:hypothetical protein